nr:MAG TPA: Cytosine specific methyltransferase [Bacteriophage sp.]
MNFVDFFAGIGGIRLGLEQAGHKCVGFCEFDKYARTAYKAMYDTEGEWESRDVRTVRTYDIPDADLWCFGFPCQDISVAGKQKGLQEGERSGLFYEIMRLLAGRRQEDRPRWLLVENVKNLLSIGNGFDFARLLLEVGGYGYSLQWDTLNSKDYGVPQNRERVFIVCYLGNISGREVFPLRRTDGENPCELKEITQGVADAQRIYESDGLARTLKGESDGQGGKTGLYAVKVLKPYGSTGGTCGLSITENETGVAAPCAARDYKGISRNNGNAVVCMSIRGQKLQKQIDVAPTIDTGCRDNLTRKQTCCAVLTPDREEKRQNGRRIKEPDEPSFTLTAQDRHGVAIFDKVCSVAYDEQNKNIRQDGTVGTLTCDGSSPKHNNRIIEYDGNIRIRRLTPRECWRLQGFPDEYFDKAKAAGISDTQLYKQAGNSVSVPVAKAIGAELRRIELCQGDTNNLKITD